MKKTYSVSRQLLVAFLATVAITTPLLAKSTVRLPAGSVDALAFAIASAGARGTVILESGLHQESATVTINIPVSLIGEAGAILQGATIPNLDDGSPDFVEPVLHVLAAQGVVVEGIAIQPPDGAIGNTGILIQNAPRTTIPLPLR
jgi:hypothetical protein